MSSIPLNILCVIPMSNIFNIFCIILMSIVIITIWLSGCGPKVAIRVLPQQFLAHQSYVKHRCEHYYVGKLLQCLEKDLFVHHLSMAFLGLLTGRARASSTCPSSACLQLSRARASINFGARLGSLGKFHERAWAQARPLHKPSTRYSACLVRLLYTGL